MKKILLGAGSLAIAAIPTITVVSCGSSEGPKPETPEQKAARLAKIHEAEVTTKLEEASTYLTSHQIDTSSLQVASSYNNLTVSDVLLRVFGLSAVPQELQGVTLENISVNFSDVNQTLQVGFTLKIETQTKTFSRTLTGLPRPKTQAEIDEEYLESIASTTWKGILIIRFKTSLTNIGVDDWQQDNSNDWIWDFLDGQEPVFTSQQDTQKVYRSIGCDFSAQPALKGFTIKSIKYLVAYVNTQIEVNSGKKLTPAIIFEVYLSKGKLTKKVYIEVCDFK